jgi:eukaryotic-like serine/threonine-protein kinase
VVAAKLIEVGPEGRQRIDRYELVAEIASGGMATVFLARLSGVGGFQRFVAIKRLHPHLAGEKEFVEMFLDEARLAAGIHHPNVVPILEVGASQRGYYLVMEYIEGDTLARLLARATTSGNRLPVSIGMRVILDMLSGLHAAHELHDEKGDPVELVHRDVSPQNVLVGVDGISRITDFGVARASSRLTATRVGQLKGKIAYMAPEQAMGAPDVDRRADVFSAGIVLWEVLAARRLFKAENEAATLSRVVSEPIPKLSQVAPEINPQVAAVVMKALERDPEKRFQSCTHFADALERAGATVERIAVGREVSAYVSQVLGNEIAQQREAVRAWLAMSEPSQVAIPEGALPGVHSPQSTTTAAGVMALPGDQSGVTSLPTATASLPPPLQRPKLILAAAALGLLVLFVISLAALISGGPKPSQDTASAAVNEPPPAQNSAAAAIVSPAPAAEPTASGGAQPAASSSVGKEGPASASAREGTRTHRPVREPVRRGDRGSTQSQRPQPAQPQSPPPKKGGDDVDLSNPYR